MKQWWNQLEERERKLVSIMLPVVFVALFYWLIWQPVHQGLDDANTAVQSQKKQLNKARQRVSQILAAKGNGAKSNHARESLSQIVSRQAKQQQIELSRMQPQNNTIDLRIDNLTFDQLLEFTLALESQGIFVEQLNLAAANTPGYVKVRSLRMGGGV